MRISFPLLVFMSVLSLTRAQTQTATTSEDTTIAEITTIPDTTIAETTTIPDTTTETITETTVIPEPWTDTTTDTTTETTVIPGTTTETTDFLESLIGVQMRITSFSDLTQSGETEAVLQQIKQELVRRGLSSSIKIKIRNVKKIKP